MMQEDHLLRKSEVERVHIILNASTDILVETLLHFHDNFHPFHPNGYLIGPLGRNGHV